MAVIARISKRDKPEALAAAASRHERHLRSALEIAIARAGRSRPIVRRLFRTAAVEGLSLNTNIKAAAVVYPALEFKSSWVSIIPWQLLDQSTPAETAAELALTVRQNLRMSECNTWPKPPGRGLSKRRTRDHANEA